MKIVHVITGLPLAGAETMLVNIANKQAAAGHDVSIVIVNDLIDQGLFSMIHPSVSVSLLHRRRRSRNPWPVVRLNLLLRKLSPDIYHIHTGDLPKYLLRSICRRSMMTLHTVPPKFYEPGIRRIDHMCAISETVAEYLHDKFGAEATVITNGIDTERFRCRKDYTRKAQFRIVAVGRLRHKIKGQHILIEAVSILPEALRSSVTIDFIGDGEDLEMLRSLAADNGVRANFSGAKPQQYIMEHLADYDLFVQPSLLEGFGLTVAEAMAADIPVLVSDSMGPAEVVDHGRFGYMFRTGDAADCARQIEHIMSRDVDKDMIARAHDRVRTLYDVSVTADNYIKEYQKIIAQR